MKLELIEHIAKQSPEIAAGVDTGGAGDQGIVVGYATSELRNYCHLRLYYRGAESIAI